MWGKPSQAPPNNLTKSLRGSKHPIWVTCPKSGVLCVNLALSLQPGKAQGLISKCQSREMLAQGYVAAQHSSATAWKVSESEEDIEVSFYQPESFARVKKGNA